MINRRRFNQGLALGLTTGSLPRLARSSTKIPLGRRALRVAAIQMVPRLGDVAANLGQAERLIRQAQRQGAEWIALPELFTSAATFHPDMLPAIQPVDGEPTRLLQQLAHQGNSVIGGSFLASRGGDAYNSFLLALPDGTVVRHDKDFPSFWENCITLGGHDAGVLPIPIGNVGSVLCWELLRSGTARRLFGNVHLAIGGSCWWTLPDNANAEDPLREINLAMLKEAPMRFARMLGVPVILGSLAGPFSGYWSPDLPDVPYDSTYLGEAVVVDASGNVLARRTLQEGAGGLLPQRSPYPRSRRPRRRSRKPSEYPRRCRSHGRRLGIAGSIQDPTTTGPLQSHFWIPGRSGNTFRHSCSERGGGVLQSSIF